jgi:hypothetical protein
LLGVFKMENQTLVVLDGSQVDIEVLEQDVADAVVGPTVQSGPTLKALNLCSLRWTGLCSRLTTPRTTPS